ncbi:hypothetical protein Cmaq_1554 [Caldivirga maquilingensis IC-167]|uniref:Uncharacterized protein n=2 Tax=Caldivirga maquilingensis TaxID=76887 RepID=A8M9F8_CALMQ|nr:hypothetical protein Cmaq_1554 [Caldivirga maquilingensis IC-167]
MVVAQRFIPIRVNVGPVTMGTGINLDDFLRRVNTAVNEIGKELATKGNIKTMGFTMTQITVSNIDGLLIVGWAYLTNDSQS